MSQQIQVRIVFVFPYFNCGRKQSYKICDIYNSEIGDSCDSQGTLFHRDTDDERIEKEFKKLIGELWSKD